MSRAKDILTDTIYVIHALTGYEYHEQRLTELFKKNGLNFEFVTEGDPSLFTDELLYKYFTKGIKTVMSTGSLSCTLNHILAYEKFVASQKPFGLFFEDDPFFLEDFNQGLERISEEIERLEKGFMISLENTWLRFPSYRQTKPGKHLYKASKGRMAGAYILDREAATRIVSDLKETKCHHVIDWWHNSLLDRGLIKMYWAQPPLVEQGSLNGYMHSTNSARPDVFTRRIAWWLQKNYKYYFTRLFNEECILD